MRSPPLPLEQRIRQVHEQLSAAERRLADVVLTRQQALLGYSATELAAMAGTSKSSAARFFRRLGYAGFEEFRQQVREQQAQTSPLARMAQVQHSDTALAQLQAHARNDARRLEAWASDMSQQALEAAIPLLVRARRVGVLGYRHSHVTAFYAQALLSQVRPEVQLLNEAAGREAEQLAGLGDKDLLLAVDLRRRSTRLPVMLEAARAAGVRVLLLSDAPVSVLAGQADVVLRCTAAAEEGLFDSYVCAISLVNYLATAVATQSHSRAQARLARIEQLHAALGDLESLA